MKKKKAMARKMLGSKASFKRLALYPSLEAMTKVKFQ
jgi:hypothetical protein